jgi:hypothetical protein
VPRSLARLNDFRAEIERALAADGGCYTIEDVAAEIDAGKVLLWDGIDCIIVTRELQYPQKRVLHVWLAAGRGGLRTIVDRMDPLITGYARGRGVDIMTFTGRRGWARSQLAERGWKPALSLDMFKEVQRNE